MINYRVMVPEDYENISLLWEELGSTNSYDDSYEGFFRYLKRNPNTSFVAEENGKIIGCLLAGHDGRRGMIHHMIVVSKYRGNGIGRELVNKAMQALANEGIAKVYITVFSDNDSGNAFWENMGFTVRNDLVYRNKYTDLNTEE